jgi:CHAT domain-containing protein
VRALRVTVLLLLLLVALGAGVSAWHAEHARKLVAACPQAALQRYTQAVRWLPWPSSSVAAQVRLALELGDFAALAATRSWWQDPRHTRDPLRWAARLEWHLSGHEPAVPPTAAELAAACARSALDCPVLRVASARWLLAERGGSDAAQTALGWSLEQCPHAGCAQPEPLILDQALRLAGSFRSARGLVNDWLAGPQSGLAPAQLAAWRMRATLDRGDLGGARAHLAAATDPDHCGGPARAAELALLTASLRLREEAYRAARAAMERAEQIFDDADDRRKDARLLPYRGYLAMRHGRWDEAAQAFTRLAEQGVNRWEQRDGWAGLGHVLMHQGEAAQAAAHYRRALDIDTQLASGDPGFRLRVLSMLAQSALQQGDAAAALEPLVSARQLARDHGDVAGEVVALLATADFLHLQDRPGESLAMLDSALQLQSGAAQQSATPFLSTQYEQALRRSYRLAGDAQSAELRRAAIATLWDLQALMRLRPQRRAALQSSAPANNDSMRKRLQDSLPPGTHLISYGYADEHAYALWLSRSGLRLIELPRDRSTLEELGARWSSALRRAQTSADPPDRGSAAALHAALIAPLTRAGLPAGDRLILNPAGALVTLPWSALGASGESGWRHLIDDHELMLVGGIDWLLRSPSSASTKPVVIASHDAPARALEEAHWVANRLGVRPLFGGEMAAAELRQAALGAGWLHFAGHGVATAEHPLRSYLSLSPATARDDGRWLLQQVLEQPITAQMVVLGACEAAHSNQATEWTWFAGLDMASAFVHAGAGQVVSSVLPAPDQATAELMQAFYAALADGDAVHALAQAQRQLARRRPAADWGGFRIAGSLTSPSSAPVIR